MQAHGWLDFIDGGISDPKWVCGSAQLRAAEQSGVERFFHVYAGFKRVLYAARRVKVGRTACLGWGRDEPR